MKLSFRTFQNCIIVLKCLHKNSNFFFQFIKKKEPLQWNKSFSFQIEDYINFLAKSPHLNVQRLIIGKTYEGRNIYALTISLDETVGNQPVLFIDAGIHAR